MYNNFWPWPISSSVHDFAICNCVGVVTFLPLEGSFNALYRYLSLRKSVHVLPFLTLTHSFMVICSWLFQQNGASNHAVTFLPWDGSFSHLVQIFPTKRPCVMYNNFWRWPISYMTLFLGQRSQVIIVGQQGIFSKCEHSNLCSFLRYHHVSQWATHNTSKKMACHGVLKPIIITVTS